MAPRAPAALLLAAVLLVAGCLGAPAPPDEGSDPPGGSPPPGGPPPSTPGPSQPTRPGPSSPSSPPVDPNEAPLLPPVARAVVAVIDTGVNPYHLEFRSDAPDSRRHPSEYIAGYPADAEALPLTLDGGSYDGALAADAEVWERVERGKLYWIPGTKIVGLISIAPEDDSLSQDDVIPGLDENGHGTMTASRAVGNTVGACPACHLVVIGGIGAASGAWAAAQPWIDVQSNSWVSIGATDSATRAAYAKAAASGQLVFAAAGNGLAGILGGVGEPTWIRTPAGAPGVIAVGGHDNGKLTPWSGSVPHVVADACGSPSAGHRSVDRVANEASGTSGATPFVAGAAARAILEARSILGDPRVAHAGALASGSPTAAGPLGDGQLTVDELVRALFRTADPAPRATPRDGAACDGSIGSHMTLPAGAGLVPSDLVRYYFQGYGAVNDDTIGKLLAVVAGDAKEPERADADAFYALDGFARDL
ncbi:MAG TPA: S8 family serine peptidase [Candidatus Thermoplasmatota archaeon]|nr:S8 family serine peptidase [Candidatus Thermoplasmatota archaeon]